VSVVYAGPHYVTPLGLRRLQRAFRATRTACRRTVGCANRPVAWFGAVWRLSSRSSRRNVARPALPAQPALSFLWPVLTSDFW